jgi:hypothetical protein
MNFTRKGKCLTRCTTKAVASAQSLAGRVSRPFLEIEFGDVMPNYFGALVLILLIGIVSTRVFLLRQQGVKAMKFGQVDKTDFFHSPIRYFLFLHRPSR